MAKYYIDRAELFKKTEAIMTQELLEAIYEAPAADVVEVVRCQNCKFGDGNGVEYLCRKHSGSEKVFGEDKNYSEWHDGSWFCADGVKK